MDPEIQPADPEQRKRVLIAMMVLALLIALGLNTLDAHLVDLQALAQESYTTAALKARLAVRWVLGLISASALGLSGYLASTSWRTLKHLRYPPPGTKVMSDTRIRRGKDARNHGRAGLILAGLTLMLTVAVLLLASNRVNSLLDTSLRPTPVSFDD